MLSTFNETSTSAEHWTNAVGNYDKSLLEAINSTEELVEMGFKSSESLTAEAAQADETAKSVSNLGDKIEETSKETESLGEKFNRTSEEADGFGNTSTKAVQSLDKVLAAAGIAASLTLIVNAFNNSSHAASGYETNIAKIATIADTAQVSIDDINSSLLKQSMDTGQYVMGLSDASYQAISASVKTSEAVAFSGTAAKLATGGFTSATTSVDVLTTAINAYGLAGSEAVNISDMLITTQNLGKTTVDELAQSVGKVIPLASAYGVEMDNLSAAYAQLTKNGVATAESGTYLRAMLNELGDSSSSVAKTISEETGFSFANLMEQGYSLGDVLDVLGNSVNNDTTKFNELWSSTQAGVGALSLFNAGSVEFNSVLGEMQKSAGATDRAYAAMTKTTEFAEQKLNNSMSNLSIVVGQQLNPTMKLLYNTGSGVVDMITSFVQDSPQVVGVISGITASLGVAVIAIGGYTAAVKIATTVQSLWNLVPPHPIFLAVTAVAALTAGIVALCSVLGEAENEYDNLTASSKRQYNELQDLNAEYERTYKNGNEMCEEAGELRWNIEKLENEYKSSKQTMDEYNESFENTMNNYNEMVKRHEEESLAVQLENSMVQGLIGRLDELSGSTSSTAAEKQEMLAIVTALNNAVPELALSYDLLTGSLDNSLESIRKLAEAKANIDLYEQAKSSLVEKIKEEQILDNERTKALREQADAREQLAKAEENYANAFNLAREAMSGAKLTDSENKFAWEFENSSKFENEVAKAKTNLEIFTSNLEQTEQKYNDNRNEISRLTQSVADLGEVINNTQSEIESSLIDYNTAMEMVITNSQTRLEELCKTYDEAYSSAYNSIEGTVGLFGEMETKAGLSSANIINAWQSQIEFLERYNDNLQILDGYNLDSEFLARLSDGSQDSANQVNSLVKELDSLSGDKAAAMIDEINAKFDELSLIKDKTASTMAEVETSFTSKLGEMQSSMEKTIDDMKMETEWAEAAKSGVAKYIEEIERGKSKAVTAAESMSSAVINALGTDKAFTLFGYGEAPVSTVPAYANGTVNAPNAYIAGEEGPELILGKAGSTVFPASETMRILSAFDNNTYNNYYNYSNDNIYENKPLQTDVPNNFVRDTKNINENHYISQEKQERKISIDINGNGNIKVDKNIDKESIIEVMYSHVKPVLMDILNREIFEEGEGAYEF